MALTRWLTTYFLFFFHYYLSLLLWLNGFIARCVSSTISVLGNDLCHTIYHIFFVSFSFQYTCWLFCWWIRLLDWQISSWHVVLELPHFTAQFTRGEKPNFNKMNTHRWMNEFDDDVRTIFVYFVVHIECIWMNEIKILL